jgi:hypothetical protein
MYLKVAEMEGFHQSEEGKRTNREGGHRGLPAIGPHTCGALRTDGFLILLLLPKRLLASLADTRSIIGLGVVWRLRFLRGRVGAACGSAGT